MPRYIDVELFSKNLMMQVYLADDEDFTTAFVKGMELVKKTEEETPTADVQEVKHAKWVHYGEYVQCSNCEHITDDFCYDDEMTMVLPYYCSNCGAKMDLEDNKGRTINE